MSEINTEQIKKEVKQELLKREIMMGLEEDEIDLFEVFSVLKKNIPLVIVFPFIVVVLVAIYSWFFMPNYFKSTTTLYVKTKTGGLSSSLANLPMAGLFSLGASGGDSGYLEAFLKSNKMSQIIIDKYNIATNTAIVGPNAEKIDVTKIKHDNLIAKVKTFVTIQNDIKTGLITIEAETMSPELSKDIVVTYIDELNKFSSEPKRKKAEFYNKQLEIYRKESSEAANNMKNFQDKHKMFTLNEHAKMIIEKLAKLESERFSIDVTLQTQEKLLTSFGSMSELTRLNALKASEEARSKALASEIDETKKIMETLPAISLEYARLQIDLTTKQKIFSTMVEQQEMATIALADTEAVFDIIDDPLVPDVKSKPRRAVMVILSALVACILGIFISFMKEFIKNHKPKKATNEETKEEEAKA